MDCNNFGPRTGGLNSFLGDFYLCTRSFLFHYIIFRTILNQNLNGPITISWDLRQMMLKQLSEVYLLEEILTCCFPYSNYAFILLLAYL